MGRYITPDVTSTVLENKFVPVTSAAGFSTGDLVYQTSSGYGPVPDGALQTGTFAISTTSATALPSANTTIGLLDTILPNAVNGGSYPVAKLTNGNYVFAYHKNSGGNSYPYFTILDVNDNVVVAETLIYNTNPTVSANCIIGVIALTGGGFVVYWFATVAATARLVYAVYSNAGAVVAAAQADTGITASNTATQASVDATGLSGGKFVILTVNSTNVPTYRIYNADGTTSSAWTTFGTAAAQLSINGITVTPRSNDTFAVFHLNSTGLNIYYDFRDSANTSLGSGNVTVGASSIIGGINSATLSTDKIILIYNDNTTSVISKFTFAAGSTTPSAITTAISGVGTRAQYMLLSIDVLDSDNYIIWGQYAILNAPPPVFYQIFNSADTAVSSLTGYSAYSGSPTASSSLVSFVKSFSVSGNIKHFNTGGVRNVLGYTGQGLSYGIIDGSTYVPIPLQAASISKGSSGSVALSGYAKSASTPTRAAFFAASTATYSKSLSTGSLYIAQTVIDTVACDSLSTASLSGGSFIVAYKSSVAPYPIYFAVVNSLGAVQRIVSVANGQAVANSIKCTVLANGNIVIIYSTSATTLLCRVYSSTTFNLLNTSTITTTGTNLNAAASQAGLAPLGPYNLFVVAYQNAAATTLRSTVCDQYGNPLTNNDLTVTTQALGITPVGYNSGNYVVGYSNASNAFIQQYLRVSDSSYTASAAGILQLATITTGYYYNKSSVLTPDNKAIYTGYATTTLYCQTIPDNINTSGAIFSTSNTNGSPGSLSSGIDVTVTANGQIVYGSGNTNPVVFYVLSRTGATGTSLIATGIAPGSSPCLSMTPMFDDVVAVGVIQTTTNYPTFAAINAANATYSVTATAGSTISETTLPLSPTNRYSLLGVAATNCSAGGSGVVQTNGVATLSNSYPATTTQGFDFTSPTGFGVRGVINGRTVTMQE